MSLNLEIFFDRVGRRAGVIFLSLIAVGCDLWLARTVWEHFWETVWLRYALSISVIGMSCVFFRCSLDDFGLRVRPQLGWVYWLRATGFMAVFVALFISLGIGVLLLSGHSLPSDFLWKFSSFSRFWHDWVIQNSIIIPVMEELTYRAVLCSALALVVGVRWAIFMDGLVFSGLHFVYGVAEPVNMIGGFVLAWAFFRSRSVFLTILLHGAGNLSMGLFHLALTYL